MAYVVSPSQTHRRWMEEYAAAFPAAALVASPGLPKKRPDLAFDRTLGDVPDSTTTLARTLGYYERFAASRLLRLVLADRGTARRVLERILAWDFDRVIIAHGDIVDSGGKAAMERAFAWLRE